MYCNNCGNSCKNNDIYCDNCGHKLQNNILNYKNVNYQNSVSSNLTTTSSENNNTANTLGTISLICLVLPFILDKILIPFSSEIKENIISSISGLLLLAGITLMIFVRIKYPNNILGKVIMWICILVFIFFIVCAFLVMIACFAFLEELKNCPG